MSNRIYSALYSKIANPQNSSDDSALLPGPLLSFLKSNNTDGSQNSTKESITPTEIEAQGRLTSWIYQADADPLMLKGMSRQQRLMGFFLCLLSASLCLCLAMLFLPVIATPFGTVNCSIIDQLKWIITKIFDWIGFFSKLFIGKEPERIRGPKGPEVDLSDFLGLFFGGNERKSSGRRRRGSSGGGGNGGLLKLLFAP
ncbi:unnamed protein product [Schistosoma mattheei]|uniref:Uncharacterized protein n=1 Tax=Schistosoma mattheei TaxID=31246 RepID=A0AA85BXF9_9TREM|nr:unnamed protein product [Schistosoma mattheei]